MRLPWLGFLGGQKVVLVFNNLDATINYLPFINTIHSNFHRSSTCFLPYSIEMGVLLHFHPRLCVYLAGRGVLGFKYQKNVAALNVYLS